MASEQFSLCWDNFHKNMSSGMNSLLENEDLVDVTLAVQGKCLKAHKMVLSVCSPYFKELFKSNPCKHPIVFMKDVSYEALSDLLQFMYQGEVQVSQENLTTFIKTAEALQIKGLTGDGNGSADTDATETPIEKSHVEEYKPTPRPKKQQSAPINTTPAIKRPRLSTSESQAPITKSEPVAQSQSDAVQFKMEPYDQSATLIDDGGDDNFGDDNLDDTANDDNEDYSMMESSMTGEEEPQAGTSTDGAGEGQGENHTPFDDEFHEEMHEWPKSSEDDSKHLPSISMSYVTEPMAAIISKKREFEAMMNEPPRFFGSSTNEPEGGKNKIYEAIVNINGRLDIIENRLGNIEQILTTSYMVNPQRSLNKISKLLPVKSIDKLKNLEELLKENNNQQQLLQVLQYIGGVNEKSCVTRCLERLFTNHCAMFCSWTGKKDNFKIGNLKSIDILKDAVRISFPSIDDNLFERHVMTWLQFAKTRYDRGKE